MPSVLIPGLFHPARKVRSVSWKVYNNNYIGSQDAMVPLYPTMDDDKYIRPEMSIFI